MSKMTEFNRENLHELRDKVQVALSVIGAEYGIRFEVGNIRFNHTSFRFRTECKINGTSSGVGGDNSREQGWREAFLANCTLYGLKPDHFGKTFRHGGKSYTICGLKPQSHKYPVLAKSARGAVYKFSVAHTGLASSGYQMIDTDRELEAERRMAQMEAAWEEGNS